MFSLLNYSHTSSFANLPYESKWHAYQPQTNVWETYATGGNQFHPEACEQKGVFSLRLQFSLRPSCAPPRCCAMLSVDASPCPLPQEANGPAVLQAPGRRS